MLPEVQDSISDAAEGSTGVGDLPDVSTKPPRPRSTRRLSNELLTIYHYACDEGDLEVAKRLLAVVERIASRAKIPVDGTERRLRSSLVASPERLWMLRHFGCRQALAGSGVTGISDEVAGSV